MTDIKGFSVQIAVIDTSLSVLKFIRNWQDAIFIKNKNTGLEYFETMSNLILNNTYIYFDTSSPSESISSTYQVIRTEYTHNQLNLLKSDITMSIKSHKKQLCNIIYRINTVIEINYNVSYQKNLIIKDWENYNPKIKKEINLFIKRKRSVKYSGV